MFCINNILLLFAFTAYLDVCLATFGNEYVHIMVHVPKELPAKHIVEHSIPEHDEVVYHAPSPHKVIHHYHHRKRRPAKQPHHNKYSYNHEHSDHDALLGSLVLSDLKSPISNDHLEYLQHADDIAEHLAKPTLKELPHKKKVNKYTVIEETVLNGYAGANAYSHSDYPHHKTKHVDTYKIIETKAPQPRPIVETLKIIDSKPSYLQRPVYGEEITRLRPVSSFGYERPLGGGYSYEDSISAKLPTSYSTSSYIAPKEAYLPPRDTYHVPKETYLPPREAYLPPRETYLPPRGTYLPPEDAYLPPHESLTLPIRPAQDFRSSSYASEVSAVSGGGGGKYLPPAASGSLNDAYDYSPPAVETYTGIDSYTAPHVQGIGGLDYQHSLPYH